MIVWANDRENDQVVTGNVKIGSAAAGTTGIAFGFTFSSGAPPASTVGAANYKAEAITWNLVDPPPEPPRLLHLSISNQAFQLFTIVGVTWNILRQDIVGLTPISSPAGQAIAVTPPSNGQYHVHSQVSVNDLTNGGTIDAVFRGNVVIGGVPVVAV